MKEPDNNFQQFQHECPHCHFREDKASQLPPYLPMRSVVGDKYLVGVALDTNGDSITYMAFNMLEKKAVLLHEFFPGRVVSRHGTENGVEIRPGQEAEFAMLKGSYTELWSKLQKMQGLSALVQTLDLFEDNNTVYAVSEYVEGSMSLRDYLLSSKHGYLPWEETRVMFMPVLSTLANLHSAGIIHRGISPATLMVYPDRKLHITGFCLPETRTVNSGLATEVYPGYTPIEQLGLQSAAGPWTDIYSFAAVLYRTLTGKTPVEASLRMERDTMKIPADIAETLPEHVIYALINALQVYPEDRTRSIDTFRAELDGSRVTELANEFREEEKARKRQMYENRGRPYAASAASMIEEEPEEEEEPHRKKKSSEGSRTAKIVVITVASVLLVIGLIIGMVSCLSSNLSGCSGGQNPEDEQLDVPNFVGENYEDLQTQYQDSFKFVIKQVNSDDVEAGIVISQSPLEGQKVNKGDTITLTVSKGSEQITMPDNIVGMTYEDASQALTQLGFKVSKTEKQNDGTQSSGTVASASLTAGKSYNKGTECRLQVWGEPVTSEPTDSGGGFPWGQEDDDFDISNAPSDSSASAN